VELVVQPNFKLRKDTALIETDRRSSVWTGDGKEGYEAKCLTGNGQVKDSLDPLMEKPRALLSIFRSNASSTQDTVGIFNTSQ
jgi:hypothetical protein